MYVAAPRVVVEVLAVVPRIPFLQVRGYGNPHSIEFDMPRRHVVFIRLVLTGNVIKRKCRAATTTARGAGVAPQ